MKKDTQVIISAGHNEDRMAALTSLAILKADIDEQHRDYIDYIIPFVKDVLHQFPETPIKDSTISAAIREKFGLRIPNKTVQLVLRRLVKLVPALLEKHADSYFTCPPLPASDLGEKARNASNGANAVVQGISDFAEKNGTHISHDEALTALVAFLRNFGVECLRAYVFDTALPVIAEAETSQSTKYIVGRFVQHIKMNDIKLFTHLMELVKGQMYSNALMCPDLESLDKKFQNLNFYLDSPLVFNLLGMHGTEQQAATVDLIEMLKELKGHVYVFSHTIDECRRMLTGLIAHFGKSSAKGRMAKHVVTAGIQVGDLILLKGDLENELRKYSVNMKPTPDYNIDLQIDESAFSAVLDDEVNYYNERALLDDINSVRSIYALRRSIIPLRLEDANAVFVTSNGGFANAAYEFGKTHNASKEVSSVITEYSLANVAWLKIPMKRPDLPETELMALCYAAMEPPSHLIQKYLNELDKQMSSAMLTPSQHVLLRTPQAEDELMMLTLGDDTAFEAQTVKTILTNLQDRLVGENKEKLSILENELSRKSSEHDLLVSGLTRKANTVAKILVSIPIVVLVACMFYGALVGASLIGPGTPGSAGNYTSIILALAFVIISIYALYSGATVKAFWIRISEKLAIKIIHLFMG